jgi:hypothetical protein
MIPQFRQNKISGLSIAWARACWDYDHNCYAFVTDDAYEIRVTDQWMMEYGVSEEDLLDCVTQVEEALGSPEEYRPSLGLFKNSGYSNIGTTIQSRTHPAVRCVFTPTSTEDGMPDAYFEWWFDLQNPAVTDLRSYLDNFNQASGVRISNVTMSPVMPSYMEAQEFFHENHGKFSPHFRESFLSELWKYHQTSNVGFKRKLSEEILPKWVSLKKSLNEETGDRQQDILKWIDKLKDVVERETKKNKPESVWKTIGFDKGPKFLRVYTQQIHDGGLPQKSAVYFIDKEGQIYKAAGWKAPAKGVRGTIDSVDPEAVGKMLSHTLGMHRVP